MKLFCKIVAAAALLGAAVELRAGLINGIDAVVHDTVITRQDVAEETLKAEKELWRDYGDQQDVYQKKVAEAERGNLEILTERQLILHEFKTAGYNLPEKVIDDEVQAEVRSHGDRQTFIRTLEAEGTTLDRYRQRIRDHIIERAMREKNVSSEIIISPHKVEAYYQEHHETYKLPDRVKLRLIVLNKSSDPDAPQARKLADEILGKIKDGASFAEMATLYSDDKMHQQGGDRGWVRKGELRMELDEAAFSLKPGERSGVIETTEACYVAQVEGVDAAHYSSLNEVRGQIEKDLQDHERTRLQHQWIEKLKKKTFVSYYH
ncbi:MAG: peptidylprolyl isomerase [Verrucomicrobiota bacterium]|jgi:parvulin-like peptidyl-prolyl isomerase